MATIDTIQRLLGKSIGGLMGLSQDDLRALHVSQAGLKYAELARAGRMFGATFGTGTELAPRTAVPTTGADWILYNPPTSGRDLYVVQAAIHSVSGTMGLGLGMVGAVATAPTTAPTDYASSVKSDTFGAGYSGKAIFAATGTLPSTPAWITLQGRAQTASVDVGSALIALLDGMFRVPPGCVFALDAIAPTGTAAKFGGSFVWSERDI